MHTARLKAVLSTPVTRRLARWRRRLLLSSQRGLTSDQFWEKLYAFGASSGRGSCGRLAAFKAEIINRFVITQGISSVIELGCGDGNQLALANYPDYLGIDVSPTAIQLCRERFAGDTAKSFQPFVPGQPTLWSKRELALSLDVVYHLLEDTIFEEYMEKLFASASRFVIIYSSNHETASPNYWEVRHRNFSEWVAMHEQSWELFKRVPQRYPRITHESDTSESDFFFYRRIGPGTERNRRVDPERKS